MRLPGFALFFVVACSPLPESMPGADGGGSDAGIEFDDAGRDGGADAGSDGGVDAGTRSDAGTSVPVITSATVVTHGSIRVQWNNPNPLCDGVTLMRSKDGAAAMVASQPTPTATEVVDAPGHASGTYCYALVCSRGGASEGASNEKCATQ